MRPYGFLLAFWRNFVHLKDSHAANISNNQKLNLSNENINIDVSVVFKKKRELKCQNEPFLKYHYSGNTSLNVFITEIIWRAFDLTIDHPWRCRKTAEHNTIMIFVLSRLDSGPKVFLFRRFDLEQRIIRSMDFFWSKICVIKSQKSLGNKKRNTLQIDTNATCCVYNQTLGIKTVCRWRRCLSAST